ncbi:homoserine kinase [Proteocatella sphenisci]|uniref:homoserine kinase n=1 Tax=Proteocatella sphenisci TaxID=181070 RepID=UPI00048FC2C5|nr:homoserine kinase [Proteocatella sphenisci]
MKDNKEIVLRVPATCANIGPGFDSLGMALNIYTDVSFEKSGMAPYNNPDNIELELTGFESRYANRENLVYKSFVRAVNHISGVFPQKLKIGIKSEVPVCRGLGSSAACIVAAVKAAYELSGKPYSDTEVLEVCNLIEGHPDNVTPALMGGFTAAIQKDGQVFMSNIPVSKDLRFFAFVPDFSLSTEYSRSVLPQNVDFKDAVYNVSHVSLMIAAFVNSEFDILKTAVSDRLHQKYRSKIIDEYEEVVNICKGMSATATFLSGAGPTVMVIDQNLSNTLEIYQKKLSRLKRGWKAYELKIDFQGTRIKES